MMVMPWGGKCCWKLSSSVDFFTQDKKRKKCHTEHLKVKDSMFRGSKRRIACWAIPASFLFVRCHVSGEPKQRSVRKCYRLLKAPADSPGYYSRWTASTRALHVICEILLLLFVPLCLISSLVMSVAPLQPADGLQEQQQQHTQGAGK